MYCIKAFKGELKADYCIPNKIRDCENSCPKQCEKDEVHNVPRNQGFQWMSHYGRSLLQKLKIDIIA